MYVKISSWEYQSLVYVMHYFIQHKIVNLLLCWKLGVKELLRIRWRIKIISKPRRCIFSQEFFSLHIWWSMIISFDFMSLSFLQLTISWSLRPKPNPSGVHFQWKLRHPCLILLFWKNKTPHSCASQALQSNQIIIIITRYICILVSFSIEI